MVALRSSRSSWTSCRGWDTPSSTAARMTYDAKDDYPDYAKAVGLAVQRAEAGRGIMLCGSGVGACVAANKMRGVRASVCHDTYSAAQGVEHDAMNVLCLGSRIIGDELARSLVRAFAGAQFSSDPRFQRRLDKVNAIEDEQARRGA